MVVGAFGVNQKAFQALIQLQKKLLIEFPNELAFESPLPLPESWNELAISVNLPGFIQPVCVTLRAGRDQQISWRWLRLIIGVGIFGRIRIGW